MGTVGTVGTVSFIYIRARVFHFVVVCHIRLYIYCFFAVPTVPTVPIIDIIEKRSVPSMFFGGTQRFPKRLFSTVGMSPGYVVVFSSP